MGYNFHSWTNFKGQKIPAAFRPPTNDWNTLQSILAEDEYHLKELHKEGISTVIDIGAHIGGFALLAASVGAKSIEMVEILPENIELINASLKANGLEGATVHAKAIGAKSGDKIKAFYMPTDTPINKHHEFVGNTSQDTGGAYFEIEVIDLNEILSKYDRVDVLKIDCEGAEWDAFSTVTPENLAKVRFIVGELHPRGTNTEEDFLNLLGNKFERLPYHIVDTKLCYGNMFLKNKDN